MRQVRGISWRLALNAGLAYLVGLVVVLGFFMRGFDILLGLLSDWVTLLVSFALLLGIINVVRVHWQRIRHRQSGWFYSLVLVASALIVLVLGLWEGTPGGASVQWVFSWIYVPLGASLFALLAFFLLTAALRTLRAGPSAAWFLLAVATLVIAGSAPWSQIYPLDVLSDIRDNIVNFPALAGTRGLLLGAALGAIATSVRILLGFDRPYMSVDDSQK